MMRTAYLCVAVVGLTMVAGVPCAQAQTITDLFNTGVNAGGTKTTPITNNQVDLHYTMIANNFNSASTTTFVLQSPNGSWVQSADAGYIAPDGSDGGTVNGGNYIVTYRTFFTLPNNVNLNSVNIAGGWSTDNGGLNILINGTATGFTSPGFSSFTGFTLPTGSYVTGSNTLDFQWQNGGGPGGLDVRFTSKSFTTAAAATPEPGSLAGLMGMGLAGSLMALRRRSRAKR